MARSIYATFKTEEQAERATGAPVCTCVAAEDVSFVISDPLMHPTVFHPGPRPTPNSPPQVDVVPPCPFQSLVPTRLAPPQCPFARKISGIDPCQRLRRTRFRSVQVRRPPAMSKPGRWVCLRREDRSHSWKHAF